MALFRVFFGSPLVFYVKCFGQLYEFSSQKYEQKENNYEIKKKRKKLQIKVPC